MKLTRKQKMATAEVAILKLKRSGAQQRTELIEFLTQFIVETYLISKKVAKREAKLLIHKLSIALGSL